MELLMIFLFLVSANASGLPHTVNGLLNEVDDPLDNHGYEVRETLSERTYGSHPHHVVTTTVHREDSDNHGGGGSSYATEKLELKKSATGSVGHHESSGGTIGKEDLGFGRDNVQIVEPNINAHRHSNKGILSDSLQHSVGKEVPYTHKPILLRSLTLSEGSGQSRSNNEYNDEDFSGGKLSSDQITNNEETLAMPAVVVSNADTKFVLAKKKYNEIVRKPHPQFRSSHGSQDTNGFVQNQGSNQITRNEGAIINTANSPKVNDNAASSLLQHNTFETDGELSVNNQGQLGYNGYLPSVQPSGTRNSLDHSRTGHRVDLFPIYHPYYSGQQNMNGYLAGANEFGINQNSNPYNSLPTQIGPESYLSTNANPTPQQPILHHIDHFLRSHSKKEHNPTYSRDLALIGQDGFGFSNPNFYLSSFPDQGFFGFDSSPFPRPHPSINPFSREGLHSLSGDFSSDSEQ